ncbi:MAG: hypothetical protein ACLFQ5_03040 [Oceanicaulis sp.]
MLTPRRKAALICLAIFFVLALLAVHASPVSNTALETRLQTRADAALYDIRADEWAQVRLDGQAAYLTGRAPTPEARNAALAAVARADWAGGVVAGGITRVIDETTLANIEEDFTLSASLNGGRLTLSGFAPDADAAARIEALAGRLFAGRVEGELRLYPGGAPLGWEAAVRLLLEELARLDAGAGLIEDARIALAGLAANEQTAEAVRAAFDAAPGEFLAAALVRLDGDPYRGRIEDGELCALVVRAALAGRPVSFSPGLDALTQASATALRQAGEVYAACTSEPLQVRVRADAEGDELARARAEAIVAAMARGGPSRDRFVTAVAPADARRAVAFDMAEFEPVSGRPAASRAAGADPAEGTEAEGDAVSEEADAPNPEG